MRSAGALVWRFADPGRVDVVGEAVDPADIEVLMVHRPRYRDWSWPKGKAEPGEPIVVAAVREVEEETGIAVILGVPLATQRYRLGSGHTKEVHYWVGVPVPAGSVAERLRAPVVPAPRGEIDQIRWARPDAAEAMLTRRGDRRLLAELASHARAGTLLTTAVALVRPGDAAGPGAPGRGGTAQGTAAPVRANTHEEALVPPGAAAAASGAGAAAPTAGAAAPGAALVRPAAGGEPATSGEGMLSRLGVRRAFDLVELMSAFGVDRAYAARADRARRTLAPWAAAGGGQVLVAEGEAPRGPTTAAGPPHGAAAGAEAARTEEERHGPAAVAAASGLVPPGRRRATDPPAQLAAAADDPRSPQRAEGGGADPQGASASGSVQRDAGASTVSGWAGALVRSLLGRRRGASLVCAPGEALERGIGALRGAMAPNAQGTLPQGLDRAQVVVAHVAHHDGGHAVIAVECHALRTKRAAVPAEGPGEGRPRAHNRSKRPAGPR